MMLTRSDHRILGALQFVDAATGVTIVNSIQVRASGVQFVRNRSGYAIAFAAPGVASLKDYGDAFDAPLNTPEVNSVAIDVQVTDPTGEYLPRRYILSLPRNPDPLQADQPDSVFQPAIVPLFRSPSAKVAANWAVIHATVKNGDGHRLPWSLIRVIQSPTKTTLSQADWRGEALIAVPGIPVTTSGAGSGAVIVTETTVTLQIVFDTALQTLPERPDFSLQQDPNQGYLPNPDRLNAGEGTLQTGTLTDTLAAGRDRAKTLTI